MRHAYRDRNDLDLLADQSPLGQILTDRACGTVVAAFTLGGFPDIGDIPLPRTATRVKREQTGVRNNGNVVESKKIVQALAKKRHPADHNGEKPR